MKIHFFEVLFTGKWNTMIEFSTEKWKRMCTFVYIICTASIQTIQQCTEFFMTCMDYLCIYIVRLQETWFSLCCPRWSLNNVRTSWKKFCWFKHGLRFILQNVNVLSTNSPLRNLSCEMLKNISPENYSALSGI